MCQGAGDWRPLPGTPQGTPKGETLEGVQQDGLGWVMEQVVHMGQSQQDMDSLGAEGQQEAQQTVAGGIAGQQYC